MGLILCFVYSNIVSFYHASYSEAAVGTAIAAVCACVASLTTAFLARAAHQKAFEPRMTL